MLGYLALDIICSSKLTVFLELRSRKTVRFSEQITSADKYPSIFSRQMKAIVYLYLRSTLYIKAIKPSFVYKKMYPKSRFCELTTDEIQKIMDKAVPETTRKSHEVRDDGTYLSSFP